MQCTQCHEQAIRVARYSPPSGIDPKMRQYQCENGHLSYAPISVAQVEAEREAIREIERKLAQKAKADESWKLKIVK